MAISRRRRWSIAGRTSTAPRMPRKITSRRPTRRRPGRRSTLTDSRRLPAVGYRPKGWLVAGLDGSRRATADTRMNDLVAEQVLARNGTRPPEAEAPVGPRVVAPAAPRWLHRW